MSYTVPEEILKHTAKCKKGHACVNNGSGLCQIDLPTETSVYVKCKVDNPPCDYRVSFGDIKRMCTCPTRLELYIRYGI
jgi:hypothetical protein